MSYLKTHILIFFLFIGVFAFTQNSMVGDGFGGRKWYQPTNYTVGSYSGYSICYDDSSQLYGWGNNVTNQLGLGPSIPGVNIPTPIPNMTNVKYFSTGYNMGAIKNDNTGWIWGIYLPANYFGPVQVITNAYFLDASSYNISFIKTDGTVWTMGDNFYGQFGNGTTVTPVTSFSIPTQMSNITNAVRVANSYAATIVLLADSTLVSCGDNSVGFGNIGLGPSIQSTSTPLPITGLPKIVDIKSTAETTIALAANGDVYSWGKDYITGTYNDTPVLLPALTDIIAISGCDDGYHFLALDENKNCYGWGDNWGQYGTGSNLVNTPILVASNVIDIMAGETFSYIVKSDGSLWASGGSNGASIWLNLPDTFTDVFIQLDPGQVLNACPVVGVNIPVIENDTIISSIFFPNVFTPNGDNENDNFYFPNKGIEELNCKIFNRWGTKIYEWDDINGFWYGKTTAGKECPDGTYYYLVSYKRESSENWERHKGFVTLLR